MLASPRAAVRPRVVSPETGDIVLLEDEFEVWLKGRSLTFEIVGGPGSGKSTALAHLVAVYGAVADVHWLDDHDPDKYLPLGRTVYTTSRPTPQSRAPSLELALWTDDELLEYCLVRHREQCQSILERCRAMADRERLQGVPLLWSTVIDALAANPSARDWRQVILDVLTGALPGHRFGRAGEYCVELLLGYADRATKTALVFAHEGRPLSKIPLLAQPPVQVVLAATHAVAALENRLLAYLAVKWPAELIGETARLLADSPVAWQTLLDALSAKIEVFHANAATLLHKAGNGWQPTHRPKPNFKGADFRAAIWPAIDLSHARLEEVDLSGADLSKGRLDSIAARAINLRRATLRKASLVGAKMREAIMPDADLSEAVAMRIECHRADVRNSNLRGAKLLDAQFQSADLSGACLADANLDGAFLSGATVDGADFSRADLRGARLHRVRLSNALLDGARLANANLTEADLEGIDLPDADFQHANLTRAYLTGSSMPRANFRGAIFEEAGLAEVSWEYADLRDADFSNCAFHLGSSRSGLVGSPIACEGSRTGFYTDDFLEQDFKSPEEIRKADLRDTDLRGAIVKDADFYLVDLRGARYTPEQADHFRRCGAILVDRVAGRGT